MVQRDLGRLQNWSESISQVRQRNGQVPESALHRCAPKGVLRDNKKTMSQQYAFMAKHPALPWAGHCQQFRDEGLSCVLRRFWTRSGMHSPVLGSSGQEYYGLSGVSHLQAHEDD